MKILILLAMISSTIILSACSDKENLETQYMEKQEQAIQMHERRIDLRVKYHAEQLPKKTVCNNFKKEIYALKSKHNEPNKAFRDDLKIIFEKASKNDCGKA